MKPSKILIVGAGAMGMITAYLLHKGGTEISFLVRPNRVEQLAAPQILYSYDDNLLHEFSGYHLISDPSRIEPGKFDFIILTIDGMALRSVEGQALLQAIGAAARGTSTKVLIGTIGVNLRPEFLAVSGLAEDQVFVGGLYTLCYQVDRVTLPVHPPTDSSLLARADFAYRQASPIGIFVDDSAPEAAQEFARLFDASGLSKCAVLSSEAYSTQVPSVFPIFAACDIMGWPSWTVLQTDTQLWALTAAAVREIQGLSINGETGRQAQEMTSAEGLIAVCRQLEEETLPLDLWAFNRFHHGGKVFAQDVALLEDCIALGVQEGRAMEALKSLVARVTSSHRSDGAAPQLGSAI